MGRRFADITEDRFRSDRELYLSQCLKIVPKQGGGLIPFTLKAEQRRLYDTIDQERRNRQLLHQSLRQILTACRRGTCPAQMIQ